MRMFFQSIKDKFSGVSKDECVKFQGISLGESIGTFEAQLQARGWVKDPDIPKAMKSAIKLYNGTFNGKKVDLIIHYNIVFRNIQFVGVSYERTSKDQATKQNQENIDKLIETYGIQPQEQPIGYSFEMKHGRIACKVVYLDDYDDDGQYRATILYANKPNNVRFVERG